MAVKNDKAIVFGMGMIGGIAIGIGWKLIWKRLLIKFGSCGVQSFNILPDSKNEVKPIVKLDQSFRGLVTSCCIYVGDKLNLYKTMFEAGPLLPYDLANKHQLDERFIKEWLLQQASAGILNYNSKSKKFAIKSDYVKHLLHPSHAEGVESVIGLFQWAPAIAHRLGTNLLSAMKSGIGQSYDGSHKNDIARAIETMHYNVSKRIFCNNILNYPEVGGKDLIRKLEKGCSVAEVGCGTGQLLISMAEKFPNSSFDGYELSQEAIAMTKQNITKSQVKNVNIFDVNINPLGEVDYDLVVVYDVIHDCTNPISVLQDIRKCINAKDAIVIIIDIESFDDVSQSISKPSSETRYGISCAVCAHSGASEKGTKGGDLCLGTLGLHPKLFKTMALEAGFNRFNCFNPKELTGNTCYTLQA